MKRIDVALVERGLAPSRTKAQELVSAGDVEVLQNGQWSAVSQSSFPLEDSKEIRLKDTSVVLRYVSRGGLKLAGALEDLKLDVKGFRCLDVGISTGGFADCLLQHGAASVCGIDVGHGQLDKRLATEPRLISFEGVHVKDLGTHEGVQRWLGQGALDLCVADLSFISFISVLPWLNLPSGAKLLGLIKPQFEVGPGALDKRGVADPKLFDDVQGRVLLALKKYGFSEANYFASRVKGQDGNQEFFVCADRI